MTEQAISQVADGNKNGAGMTAGIIACVLAVLGILFIGIVFVPLAMIVATIGTVIAVKNKNTPGIGVNALAWVLASVGFVTSPLLWGLFFSASIGAAAMTGG